MTTLRLIFVALVFARPLMATTYFVSNGGSNFNKGTSSGMPWAFAPGMAGCTAACASTRLQPGDSLLFKRGDTWRDELDIPRSGLVTGVLAIDAYGSGPNPIISGSSVLEKGGWALTRAQFTYGRPLSTDPGRIVSQNGQLLSLQTSLGTVESSPGSFFWSSNTLFVHPLDNTDPNNDSSAYEAAVRPYAVNISGKSYITIQNLTVTGALKVGLLIQNASDHITVRDSAALYNNWQGFASGADGGSSSNVVFQRLTSHHNFTYAGIFGNVNISFTVQDCLSYGNGTDNFRDHGFYIMGHPGTLVQRNVSHDNAAHGFKFGSGTNGGVMAYNLSYNNGGAGYFLDGLGTGASFYNSVSYHDLWGIAVYTGGDPTTLAAAKNMIVRSATQYGVITDAGGGTGTITSFTNNDISNSATGNYHGLPDQTGSNGNINTNPSLVNESGLDLRLSKNSPDIDAGANLGIVYQNALDPDSVFPFLTVNQNSAGVGWDIGAFVFVDSRIPSPPVGLQAIVQ